MQFAFHQLIGALKILVIITTKWSVPITYYSRDSYLNKRWRANEIGNCFSWSKKTKRKAVNGKQGRKQKTVYLTKSLFKSFSLLFVFIALTCRATIPMFKSKKTISSFKIKLGLSVKSLVSCKIAVCLHLWYRSPTLRRRKAAASSSMEWHRLKW